MPITTTALIAALDALLDAPAWPDHGPNGLQVSGVAEITCLASAATASLAACQGAVAAGAQALLVHHGLIWGEGPGRIVGPIRERLACLLNANCALIAYHLPLDAHPQRGNNAVALRRLGAVSCGSFAPWRGRDLGRVGELPMPLDAAELARRCESAFAHPVLHCPGGPVQVRRLGVVTGGGQRFLAAAAHAGLDALITGESSEQSWHEAAEYGIHLFACGHHATECHAVHELAADLAQQHGLRHRALAESNPC